MKEESIQRLFIRNQEKHITIQYKGTRNLTKGVIQ